MIINTEKLVNNLTAVIEMTEKQIEDKRKKLFDFPTFEEGSQIMVEIDQLIGYKFALEDVLETLPDFEQKD